MAKALSRADVVLGLHLSFLSGVALASFGVSRGFFVLALLAAVPVLYRHIGYLSFLCVLGLFIGWLYYAGFISWQRLLLVPLLKEELLLEGVITTEPQLRGQYQLFEIFSAHHKVKIHVIADSARRFEYGDRLSVQGRIREERPGRGSMERPRIQKLESGLGNPVRRSLLALKRRIIGVFDSGLPADRAALMSGILLGVTNGFTPELRHQMALSGTTHLVALSGFNISILVVVIGSLLSGIVSPVPRAFVTGVVILFFLLLVGFQASIVRAAIMGFLATAGRAFGRQGSVLHLLAFAAALMIVLAPDALRFDIGFQLSFLSLLGIVYLAPRMDRLINPQQAKSFMHWREHASTTIAAQSAVAPLLIAYFDDVSFTSVLANMLILEFVPLTMLVGFVMASFAFLSEQAVTWLAWPAHLLLGYELFVVRLFAWFRVPFGPKPWSYILIAAWYGLLMMLGRRLKI